jgi:hypothetical protein
VAQQFAADKELHMRLRHEAHCISALASELQHQATQLPAAEGLQHVLQATASKAIQQSSVLTQLADSAQAHAQGLPAAYGAPELAAMEETASGADNLAV